MAALDFPASPTLGQLYPVSPPAGTAQYSWDGEKWISATPSADVVAASAAEYRAGTNTTKFISPKTAFDAAASVTLADAVAVTPDFALGFDFAWTLGAVGRTLNNPGNIKIGQKGIIVLNQGIAGATITTWGSFYKFPGGIKPSLSITAGAVDILSYSVISANAIACNFAADYK